MPARRIAPGRCGQDSRCISPSRSILRSWLPRWRRWRDVGLGRRRGSRGRGQGILDPGGVDFRPEKRIPGASMKRHQIAIVVAVFLPLVFMAGYAAGQRQIPQQNVGQSDELLRTLDLTTELASTKGRTLRMRKVTLQPGGV